jgi:hypothetical protein
VGLMIFLGTTIGIAFVKKPCTFVLWLDLFWEHAPDILGYSLPEDRKIHEISLMESPFWTSQMIATKSLRTVKVI